MNILAKLLGQHRFNEAMAPTRPGGWIAQDPLTGRLTANLMLRLHTSMLEPAMFKHLPLMLGPNIEVRTGLLARRVFPSELGAWVKAHKTPDLVQVAQDSAKHLAREGLREVRQYLWLVATVTAGAPPQAMDALLDELENHGRAIASHLRVRCHPVDDCREVAKTYEAPSDPTGGIPSVASTFFPVQPDWTGYLQPGWGPLDGAHMVVPELLHLPHSSFTVWVTAQTLSRRDCRRAARDLRSSLQTLLSPGRTEHIRQRRLAAEVGDLLRCQYQLTLHHCAKGLRQQAQAAMQRHGLAFYEESPGFLGWRATKKAFWAHGEELAACCPLQELADCSTDHGGLLLRTDAGIPMVLDPFHSDTNHNVMVAGGQGAGKDYLCRSLLSTHVAQGHPAWLVAGKGSAVSTTTLVDMLGGRSQVLELDGTGLNPLAMCVDEDDVFALRNWMASLISPVVADLDPASLLRLERAMVVAWEHRNGPLSLEQVRQELEREDDALCRALALALAPYTREGEYARLFSGEPIDLSTDSLLVLDTTAFADANAPVLTMTLMSMLSLHWKHMGIPRKLAYFDAGDEWARYDYQLTGAATLIQAILRRARMRNGAIVTCLPYSELKDWRRLPVIQAVVENTAWHLLMQVPRYAEDLADLRRDIGYPARVADLWQRARTIPHQLAKFVLVSGTGAQLLSLSPGKLHLAMHAPDDLCGRAYQAARQQGLSPLDALDAAVAARDTGRNG
ncbi:hypothetical protein WJ97_11360 [Burkholderia ubonensis]|uniref:hypothetical protein n=1 Tax=Burkholderia ubonensis TaxID=101571 RepID=UPI00075B8FA0|nr:hypothetical protein [Burkholderia ubonensis]KVP96480.1 hypothetical protein WJ97_11360 [Burkholderia ubonensis]